MKRIVFLTCLVWTWAAGAVPGHGDARFTEIMANSTMGTDWVEIENTADHEINLGKCKLRVGLGKVREKVLPDLPMAPGRHVVIAGTQFPPECDYHADLTWSGVKLRSSRPEAVELWCPKGRSGLVVDRVLFNLHAAKQKKGYSIRFCGQKARQTQGLMPGWQPTDETPFCSILGAEDHGGPGLAEHCVVPPQKPMIHPGDVEITELMVQPVSGTPEWVELTNITQKDQELTGCILKIGKNSAKPLTLDLKGVHIPPSAAVVLSNRVFTKNGLKSIELKGLKLTDSDARDVSLLCRGKLVSTVGYDPNQGDVRQGHSLCFEYSTDPGTPSGKYLASDLSPYSNTRLGVNYGTPFDPAPCNHSNELSTEKHESIGCTQGTTRGSPVIFWLFLLILMGLAGFRRAKPGV